jgi:rod shape determining protein RodA
MDSNLLSKLPTFRINKISLVILLSRYYSKKSVYDLKSIFLSSERQDKIKELLGSLILPFSFVLVPVGLIFIQPDLGTALILLIIFMGTIFTVRLKWTYILGFILSLLFLSPFSFLFLKDYQKQRLLVFLNPNYDPLGAGYTIIQSKIAIGSGRIFGKGWLSGTQSQLRFLPAAYTDFIFSSFAEEWGFLGSVILVFLYYQLIVRMLCKSQRISEPFGRLISYNITFMLSIQIIINICMSLGLLPVVGIPLPFFSYGGSNLLISFISLGVLLNITKRR